MERSSFDVFKSNICHLVKDQGELEFIKQILCSKEVEALYDRHWYAECLYLVAMVDYLCRKNDIPLYGGFNKLRSCKLDKVLYPSSVTMLYSLSKDPSILEQYYNASIPEFKRFNIVENEIEWNNGENGQDKQGRKKASSD